MEHAEVVGGAVAANPRHALIVDRVWLTQREAVLERQANIGQTARIGKLQKVTDANPQMAQFTWGTAELMHYRNGDGVPLSGILYKPENFDPHKQYPLLVYIYEKLSQNLNQFVEPAAGGRPSRRASAAR